MPAEIKLYNTLTRTKEVFKPLRADQVGVYNCGPTVYHNAHIGNLMSYTRWDVLVKTLRRFGYTVRHAMNITDVGHLSSDGDTGEDKMIIAMRREGKSPWDIARFYEDACFADMASLNIRRPDVVCRATEHVPDMIAMVQTLEKNGYTYSANGNIYFDTSKYARYTQLWGSSRAMDNRFARVEEDPNKKNPQDFVLWFGNSKFKDQAMKWESPWGVGFPGWHIECSAMATKYLGDRFDIHCGGVDLGNTHHPNEIAQAEGCLCPHCTDNSYHWVNYWLHNEFLLDQTGQKMSKSKGSFSTLGALVAEGFSPLAFRLLIHGGHYRSQIVFSEEALRSAQNALNGLVEKLQEWSATPAATTLSARSLELQAKFNAALADDLNTPVALATLWEVVKDGSLDIAQKKALIADFDTVLSLGLSSVSKGALSAEEQALFDARAAARAAKDFAKSDELRDKLAALGVVVKDSKAGQTWTRS